MQGEMMPLVGVNPSCYLSLPWEGAEGNCSPKCYSYLEPTLWPNLAGVRFFCQRSRHIYGQIKRLTPSDLSFNWAKTWPGQEADQGKLATATTNKWFYFRNYTMKSRVSCILQISHSLRLMFLKLCLKFKEPKFMFVRCPPSQPPGPGASMRKSHVCVRRPVSVWVCLLCVSAGLSQVNLTPRRQQSSSTNKDALRSRDC